MAIRANSRDRLSRWLLTSIGLVLAVNASAQRQPIAFVDVTVVPMDRNGMSEHQTVLVGNGRIEQVGPTQSVRIPNGATRIDGKGKFLMPGLADMHVHFVREPLPEIPAALATSTPRTGIPASASTDHERENRAYALMFLANGVTTVRNMWGSPAIRTFADEVQSGDIPGPFIYSTGTITDGNPPNWFSTRVVETAAQAEAAVAEDKRDGYIAIKVYSRLSPEAYAAIVASARRIGLPVVGHVPIRVGLEGAVAARQDSIEHLDEFLPSIQPGGRASQRPTLGEALRNADLTRLPNLASQIAAANVWVCPTIVVNNLPGTDRVWLDHASFVPPSVFDRYRRMYPNSGTDPRSTQKAHEINSAIVSALHGAGVSLLLGTDTVKPGVLPGYSLHEELSNCVAAGMSPYDAIRAGTADAARFLNRSSDFGVVAAGRRADLLLLNANPLEDVKNTERIAGIMASGHWFTAEELDKRLVVLRASY
jgi:imidazolonepropionase-like amidohydrolase